MKSFLCFGLTILLLVSTSNLASGQGSLVREAGEVLWKAALKYLGTKAGGEVAEEFIKNGGKALARRVAQRVVREGGEAGLERVAQMTAKYGPDVLRVIDDAPSIRPVLRALDELPANKVGTAIRRLSSSQGKELMLLVERHGVRALGMEVAHPGICVRIVKVLGDDGIRLGEKMTTDQLRTLAPYVDEIAALPAPQKKKILELLYEDTKGMIAFIGRFMEKHPGKTLFTVATTTVILTNADRILGEAEIVIDANGNPVVVDKPGLLGRISQNVSESVLKPITIVLLSIVTLVSVLWITNTLWYRYRMQKIQLALASQKAAAEMAEASTEVKPHRSAPPAH